MNRLYIFILVALFGCSTPEKARDLFYIRTEEKNLDITDYGFSSERPFVFFVSGDSFLIFDEFNQSVLQFRQDLHQTPARKITLDEKFEYSDMLGFIYDGNDIVSFHGKFLLLNCNHAHVEKIKVSDFQFEHQANFVDDFSFEVRSSGRAISSFHASSKKLFLLIKKNNEFRITEIDLSSPFYLRIHDIILHGLIQEHLIEASIMKGVTLSNTVSPQLSIVDDLLLITYPFSNLVQYLDLVNYQSGQKKIQSSIYPNSKQILSLTSETIESVKNTIKEWNSDVEFGPLYKVPKTNYFFRLVKGKSTQPNPFDGKIYLSVFDEQLELIYEKHLNEDDPFLTFEYFATDEGIYIKRSTENEDILSYLKLSLEKLL